MLLLRQDVLKETLEEAYECAAESELVKRVLPGKLSKTLA